MHVFGLSRFAVYIASFALFPSFKYALLFTVLTELIYPYVVAKVCGVSVMPAMDFMTFMTVKESPANIMCVSILKNPEENVDWMDRAIKHTIPLMKQHKKLKSKIVTIGGDLYYKEMKPEDCLPKMINILPAGSITTKQ